MGGRTDDTGDGSSPPWWQLACGALDRLHEDMMEVVEYARQEGIGTVAQRIGRQRHRKRQPASLLHLQEVIAKLARQPGVDEGLFGKNLIASALNAQPGGLRKQGLVVAIIRACHDIRQAGPPFSEKDRLYWQGRVAEADRLWIEAEQYDVLATVGRQGVEQLPEPLQQTFPAIGDQAGHYLQPGPASDGVFVGDVIARDGTSLITAPSPVSDVEPWITRVIEKTYEIGAEPHAVKDRYAAIMALIVGPAEDDDEAEPRHHQRFPTRAPLARWRRWTLISGLLTISAVLGLVAGGTATRLLHGPPSLMEFAPCGEGLPPNSRDAYSVVLFAPGPHGVPNPNRRIEMRTQLNDDNRWIVWAHLVGSSSPEDTIELHWSYSYSPGDNSQWRKCGPMLVGTGFQTPAVLARDNIGNPRWFRVCGDVPPQDRAPERGGQFCTSWSRPDV